MFHLTALLYTKVSAFSIDQTTQLAKILLSISHSFTPFFGKMHKKQGTVWKGCTKQKLPRSDAGKCGAKDACYSDQTFSSELSSPVEARHFNS